MKIFIGGSKNLTKLPESAVAKIDEFVRQGCSFLIGDCYGTDLSVQKLLAERGCKNVTIYCSGDAPRNNVGGWQVKALHCGGRGYEFFRQKDIAMVADCDRGYMIWDGKSKGTRQNVEDLRHCGKPTDTEVVSNDKSRDN